VKPVPPPGVEVPANDRAELEAGLARLKAATEKLKGNALLPDVLIYQEAVRVALQYGEFFRADEIAKAKALLRTGEERARLLANGESPWKHATGLVVRGYISKIDKSVQPYGLVVPASYTPSAPRRWRLDAWFHGRNETLSEVNFISERERSFGEFTPKDTIVLHLYGRYCNASKLAGEVDFFEALESVKRQYPIDENRILVRGFSMGGASAWEIGTHFAGLWAAVAPGAGFSETVEFLRLRMDGPNAPTAWERTLFHQYDATDYAVNLANTATVAYNGEIDGQKQAADAMERAMKEEGLRLLRIVGPQTAHRYHPDSKIEIDRRLDAIAERGREVYPRRVRFTTWTLRYNQMKWVTIDALGKHWDRARVNAEVESDRAV
jgi:dienelactone hydrolase